MLVGILSDTHDESARTAAAIEVFHSHRVDVLIHCGDIIEPSILNLCTIRPFYFVFGNNDADLVPELRAVAATIGATCLEWGDILELSGFQIAITHGHMTSDVRRLKAKQPHYFLFGHSHVATDVRSETCRWINPGALSRADEYTVAILNLADDQLQYLTLQ
jgi:uncharacterized protein